MGYISPLNEKSSKKYICPNDMMYLVLHIIEECGQPIPYFDCPVCGARYSFEKVTGSRKFLFDYYQEKGDGKQCPK